MYKICSKCKEEKLFSEFSKCKSNKDGYQHLCKLCQKLQMASYYEKHKEKIALQQLEYRQANKEKIASLAEDYRRFNKEKIIQYQQENKERILRNAKQYYQSNKHKFREHKAKQQKQYRQLNKATYASWAAKRRAEKLKATPHWLTEEQHEKMREMYICAQMFKLYTGQDYHVDHIVPLQGKHVCGLHVPWNLQVIVAKENLSKSNKFVE